MKKNRTTRRLEERDIITVVPSSAPNAQIFCLTKDISPAGLCFSAHFAVKEGEKLDLSVSFASPPLSIRHLVGRVMWVRQVPQSALNVVGVDLTGSEPDALNEWREAVAERLGPEETF